MKKFGIHLSFEMICLMQTQHTKVLLSACLFFLFLLTTFPLFSQEAPWISYPSASVTDYGVYHFRKHIQLDEVPKKLMIHVSADNRYNLFVNGKRVCYGPAKGDLQTYKYDVIDIAPFMQKGDNLLAALVFNGGKDKILAIQSVQTAFLLKVEDETYASLNTDSSWKVFKNPAYQPISYYEMLFKERWFYGFYACGPGDEVDAKLYPWGWEQADFDDSQWKQAELLSFDGKAPWNLVPRNIAFIDTHREQPAHIRLAKAAKGTQDFLQGNSSIQIAPNSHATLLFDFDIFTMGYPELVANQGQGSSIQINYAEALYETVNLKAHRDSVHGKTMFGVWDLFHPDGERRIFRPLWKRAFRYVQLQIETQDQPLEIQSFSSEYSGYPYPDMATFESNDPRLNEIFEMGLRTLRMCSGETYYDTPYYEQLSYGGDNRPIGALSTYTSTDDRLFREVLRLYPQSVTQETGLFKSAYPSRFTHDMGSWSLAWIQSLHDYYFMRGDSAFVKQFVQDIEGVLGFYERHMDEQLGILGGIKTQNFMDWSITKGSIPRPNGQKIILHSTMLSLFYAHTLDCVVRLYQQIGEAEKAKAWEARAEKIKLAVRLGSFDKAKQLFTDHPAQEIFSQHTNILAILCDVIPPAEQPGLMERILTYRDFDEYASSFFSFFLFKAMEKTGMQDRFLDHLDFWYDFIDRGHTTCGETGFASHDRSDCHAWSAHPSFYLLRFVCGIQAADIGFESILIQPHVGKLTTVKASMPHPKGRIKVGYQLKKGKLQATVSLPAGMEGTFEYEGINYPLHGGENLIRTK